MVRCKVGDLAFIVRSPVPENVGKIVRVVARAAELPAAGVLWECESAKPLLTIFGGGERCTTGTVPDCRLRPIRDEPGLDETLLLAGLPEHPHRTERQPIGLIV